MSEAYRIHVLEALADDLARAQRDRGVLLVALAIIADRDIHGMDVEAIREEATKAIAAVTSAPREGLVDRLLRSIAEEGGSDEG